MTGIEARETLKTLERLICLAEALQLRNPTQRTALTALRGRRAALRSIVARRRALAAEKTVCLAAWRDAPSMARERGSWLSAG